MTTKTIAKTGLQHLGLLESARQARSWLQSRRRSLFLRRAVALYRHPLSRPAWNFEGWRAYAAERRREQFAARFEADREHIGRELRAAAAASQIAAGASEVLEGLHSGGSLDGVDDHRAPLLRIILDRVLEAKAFPVAYEYDFLDDVVAILESRYESGDGDGAARGGVILAVLAAICGVKRDDELAPALKRILGSNHPYRPRTGEINPNVGVIIPDLLDEFVALRASQDPERFLEINREYSRRQRDRQGTYAGLSMLFGTEQNRHLMLRTLVELKADRQLLRTDEVLVVGPRHYDEILFFRNQLGLPKTTGLDLFADEQHGIVAGDMHDMPFAPGRFRAVYCAGTLSYSYDIRKVAGEMARVLARPGFLVLSDAADRTNGVDPLGRTDPMSAEAMVSCFYEHRHEVQATDPGMSPNVAVYRSWPTAILKLI